MKSWTLFMTAASILAAGAITIGISLIDSPGDARLRKLDEARVTSLRAITYHVQTYYKTHNALPPSLDALNLQNRELNDPISHQPYEYHPVGNEAYQLCAKFDTIPNDEEANRPDYGSCQTPLWKRTRGRYCYTITVKDCR